MRMMMIYKTNSKMSLFCCYTTNTNVVYTKVSKVGY